MISYNEKERVFKLDTPGTTYMIGIVDEENFVGHIYYGKKLEEAEAGYLMRTGEPPFVPAEITGSAVPFTIVSPLSIPQAGWATTGKAASASGRQPDMRARCFPM